MDRYIGLDVHAQSSTLAVLSPSGKRVACKVVETSAKALIAALKEISGRRHLCLEEGTQSDWLHEVLEPHVAELVVTVPKAKKGTKSDEADAWARAEELRVGSLETKVFKAPKVFAGLREAVRSQWVLTQDTTRVKNRLKAIYRSRGVPSTGEDIYDPEKRSQWLQQLPPSKRRRADLLGRQLDLLEPLRHEAEKWLREEAKGHSALRWVKRVPGLGPIRSAQVVATVVTPHRFRTRRQFWSYCGLAVVTRSSADWVPKPGGGWMRGQRAIALGLNRNRQPILKAVFKGAATTVLTKEDHPLRKTYDKQVSEGMRPNLAKLTLARKLATLTLMLWKREEEYDPARHQPIQNA
jgi:transposase